MVRLQQSRNPQLGITDIGKVGLFIYHEKAGTTQLVGLALGILAVAFLSM